MAALGEQAAQRSDLADESLMQIFQVTSLQHVGWQRWTKCLNKSSKSAQCLSQRLHLLGGVRKCCIIS